MPDNRPLRVAFIGARGVVGTYSGIETYYEELGSRLASKGHHVTAYCRTYFTPDLPTHRGISIRRLPCIRTKHLETLTHSIAATADALFRRFDIIQYHAIGSAPLSMIPRVFGHRTIVSVRGLDWQRAKWGRFARMVLQVGERASARCPTATVVVSHTLQAHYRAAHKISPEVVQNPVVAASPRAIDKTERFGLEKDEFLLFAGRISPEKGVHHLLEALRPLPFTKKLVLAGGSSYSERYIQDVKSAAWDQVVFLGRVDQEMMQELYSNCYAFILPSAMEGLSIALLEALSYGACIITTDIPENVEVVGTAALLFPPGDVEALRELLRQILEDSQLVDRFRTRATRRAQSLPGWDDVADRTEEVYLRLLGRG